MPKAVKNKFIDPIKNFECIKQINDPSVIQNIKQFILNPLYHIKSDYRIHYNIIIVRYIILSMLCDLTDSELQEFWLLIYKKVLSAHIDLFQAHGFSLKYVKRLLYLALKYHHLPFGYTVEFDDIKFTEDREKKNKKYHLRRRLYFMPVLFLKISRIF